MRRVIGSVFVIALLTACASTTPEPTEVPTVDRGPVPSSLRPGAAWELVSGLNNTANVTIQFDPGQVSGNATVNAYSGPAKATEDGSLQLGPLTMSEIGAGPAELQTEGEYFALLERADTWQVAGKMLVLSEGEDALLRYSPSTKSPDFSGKLVGLSVKKARAAAKREGYSVRVVSEDGTPKPATMDYRSDRVNLTVVDGKVTEAKVG